MSESCWHYVHAFWLPIAVQDIVRHIQEQLEGSVPSPPRRARLFKGHPKKSDRGTSNVSLQCNASFSVAQYWVYAM